MEENYFHPERFRVSLNSFVQEARNVTFILQKKKNELPGFEKWYANWQEKLRADPILRWIVDSRNRITKQGDLEIKSECNIEFITGWTDDLTCRFKGNPFAPSLALAKQVREQIPKKHITEESLICIERQWVEANLPNVELLQATGHALRVISQLVHDIHSSLIAAILPGFKCPHVSRLASSGQEYSTELANAEDLRKIWMTATDLKIKEYSLSENVLHKKDFDLAESHYGSLIPEIKKLGAIVELKDAVKFFQLTAKEILIKDGFHLSFAFALSDKKSFYTIGLNMEDRAGKHIAIRRTASLLKQDSIKWVIMVGEAWVAYLKKDEQPTRHASEMLDRKESLMINGVSCDGLFTSATAVFNRNKSGITIEDWQEDTHSPQIMLPILKAIQRKT